MGQKLVLNLHVQLLADAVMKICWGYGVDIEGEFGREH